MEIKIDQKASPIKLESHGSVSEKSETTSVNASIQLEPIVFKEESDSVQHELMLANQATSNATAQSAAFWYHLNIPRNWAEKLLTKNGQFLVRYTSNTSGGGSGGGDTSPFVVSIKWNGTHWHLVIAQSVMQPDHNHQHQHHHHHQELQQQQQRPVYHFVGSQFRFQSVLELIRFHVENQLPMTDTSEAVMFRGVPRGASPPDPNAPVSDKEARYRERLAELQHSHPSTPQSEQQIPQEKRVEEVSEELGGTTVASSPASWTAGAATSTKSPATPIHSNPKKIFENEENSYDSGAAINQKLEAARRRRGELQSQSVRVRRAGPGGGGSGGASGSFKLKSIVRRVRPTAAAAAADMATQQGGGGARGSPKLGRTGSLRRSIRRQISKLALRGGGGGTSSNAGSMLRRPSGEQLDRLKRDHEKFVAEKENDDRDYSDYAHIKDAAASLARERERRGLAPHLAGVGAAMEVTAEVTKASGVTSSPLATVAAGVTTSNTAEAALEQLADEQRRQQRQREEEETTRRHLADWEKLLRHRSFLAFDLKRWLWQRLLTQPLLNDTAVSPFARLEKALDSRFDLASEIVRLKSNTNQQAIKSIAQRLAKYMRAYATRELFHVSCLQPELRQLSSANLDNLAKLILLPDARSCAMCLHLQLRHRLLVQFVQSTILLSCGSSMSGGGAKEQSAGSDGATLSGREKLAGMLEFWTETALQLVHTDDTQTHTHLNANTPTHRHQIADWLTGASVIEALLSDVIGQFLTTEQRDCLQFVLRGKGGSSGGGTPAPEVALRNGDLPNLNSCWDRIEIAGETKKLANKKPNANIEKEMQDWQFNIDFLRAAYGLYKTGSAESGGGVDGTSNMYHFQAEHALELDDFDKNDGDDNSENSQKRLNCLLKSLCESETHMAFLMGPHDTHLSEVQEKQVKVDRILKMIGQKVKTFVETTA